MYTVINHLHLKIPVDQLSPGIEQEAILLLRVMFFLEQAERLTR